MSVIKVKDLAYGRLRSPDLDAAEEFLTHFGMIRAHGFLRQPQGSRRERRKRGTLLAWRDDPGVAKTCDRKGRPDGRSDGGARGKTEAFDAGEEIGEKPRFAAVAPRPRIA